MAIEMLRVGIRKIMKVFYSQKTQGIHLREIARQTGLNENSVSRFLKELENYKILSSINEGNLKKYKVNYSDNSFIIFECFDRDKFNSLPNIRKNAVDYLIEKLEEKPIFAILFGSSVKGNFKKNSDIDILLVVNKGFSISKATDYAESQTGIRVQAFLTTYREFLKEIKLKEDMVIQSALETGYPVYNIIEYYKEILK